MSGKTASGQRTLPRFISLVFGGFLAFACLAGAGSAQAQADRPIFSQGGIASPVTVGGTVVYAFSVERGGDITAPNNQGNITNLAVSIPLPAGLNVATPNGATTSCFNLTTSAPLSFTGTLNAEAGASTISLSGVTLEPRMRCEFRVTLITSSLGEKSIDPGVMTNDQTASRDPGRRFFDVVGPTDGRPVLITPRDGDSFASGASVLVSGYHAPNNGVLLSLDSNPLAGGAVVPTDPTGRFEYSIAALTGSGAHQITARDSGGANPVQVSVNVTGGTPPSITTLSPASGPAAGGTVVTLNGANFTGATGVAFGATPASAFTVVDDARVTATAPAGVGLVEVTVTTPTGTSSTAGGGNDYLYIAAPMAPTTVSPANGALTNDNTPAYAGTAEPNSSVSVVVDGVQAGLVTADGAGVWTFAGAALADGPHTVRSTATNAGGVSPPSNTNTFTVDTTAPAAPVITAPTAGQTTADNTPTVTGTAEAGATLSVRIDGALAGTTTADGAGLWSLTATTLADGPHTVAAEARDSLGNTSASSTTISFTVDTTAPAAPVITAPTAGQTTADNTPTVTGTAEAGATLSVRIDGALAGTATADGAGLWSLTATTLADGPHTVAAEARDSLGNTSASSTTISFTVDTTAPAAPVITAPTAGQTTADNTPTVTGTAEAGATLSIRIDGALAGTTTADGAGLWSLTATTLADGPHTVAAEARDSLGNTSASSTTISFTVDTTAPAAPVITAPTAGVLVRSVLEVRGTAEAGSTVTVYISESDVSGAPAVYRVLGSVPVANGGDWTLTLPSAGLARPAGPMSVGEKAVSLYAVSADAVSNTSEPSALVNLTTDRVAPLAPTVTGPTDGQVVNTATPEFTGLAEPGTRIAIHVDGQLYAQTVSDGAGQWRTGAGSTSREVMAAPAAGLLAGPHTWHVVAEDAAGNVSPPSPTLGFVVVLVAIDQTEAPSGAVAAAYEHTLTASGGVAPYRFAVSAGALPAGLALSPEGVLSGTPTAGGVFGFTVTVTDDALDSASRDFVLTIAVPTVTATNSIAAARRGFAYSQPMVASGGTGPYSFALESGALPAGISLSAAGLLSGTPTEIGTFPFTVRITDSSTGSGPYTTLVSLNLVVDAAAISLSPTTLPGVMAGLPYDQTLSASGGVGTYTYAVTAGALPAGMSLSTTGRLSGRSYVLGSANFTITATDSFGNTGSAALVLTVLPRPDPSADPDVRGVDAAQAEATRRLTSTQIDNFSRRLEQIRQGDGGGVVLGVSVQSGIVDLAQAAERGALPVSGRLYDRAAADPDRAQLHASLWGGDASGAGDTNAFGPVARGSDPSTSSASLGAPRIWTGGAITVGHRDADGGQARLSVTSSGLSVGADVAVSPTLDLGFGLGFGEESVDVGRRGSAVESDAIAGVFYGSWRPRAGVYLDGTLGYGHLSFETRRRVSINDSLVFGNRDGKVVFGSLGLGMERSVGSGHLATYGRFEGTNAELDAYVESGSPFWALAYEARDVESLQGVLGGRYAWSWIGRDSIVTPGIRLEFRKELAEGGLQSLGYADWTGGPAYQIEAADWDRGEVNLGLEVNVQAESGWRASGELGGRFSSGQSLGTVRLSLSTRF